MIKSQSENDGCQQNHKIRTCCWEVGKGEDGKICEPSSL